MRKRFRSKRSLRQTIARLESLEPRQMLAADLVADLAIGSAAINPENAVVAGDRIYFTADDGVHGRELWISDGTTEGTALVSDITPGADSSAIELMFSSYPQTEEVHTSALLGDEFFFFVTDEHKGPALWKTTGTPDGTQLVREFEPRPERFSQPTRIPLTAHNGEVFFGYNDNWLVSDGTSEGTRRIRSSSNTLYVSAGENLLSVWNANHYAVAGEQLIYSTPVTQVVDGKKQHTIQVNVTNGTNSETLIEFDSASSGGYDIEQIVHVNGLTYFVRQESVTALPDRQIWTTDGTKENTKKLLSIGGSSSQKYLYPAGDTLFFKNDGNLWKTNGTTDGTVAVKGNIGPTFQATNIGNNLYFAYEPNLDEFGEEPRQLWVSDGTEMGTVQISDVALPNDNPYGIAVFSAIGEKLIFRTENARGLELWAHDSTTGETGVLFEPSKNESSNPVGLTQLNESEFVFVATNEDGRNQLWKSNGETTTAVSTIPAPHFEERNPFGMGTISLPVFDVHFIEFVHNNGEVYFLQAYQYIWGSGNLQTSYDLWKTDGTQDGTLRVEQHAFTFFFEDEGVFDPPLLVFENGEPSLIARPMTFDAEESDGAYTLGRNEVFFAEAGYNESDAAGLWVRNDGEEQFLAEFEVDALSEFKINYSLSSPTLYFEVGGKALWKTDGTVEGTILDRPLAKVEHVGDKQFSANSAGSLWVNENGEDHLISSFDHPISNLAAFNDNLFFVVNGQELWQSDGTEAGTTIVADGLSDIRELTASASGLLYFVADDGIRGSEVWQTDGTTAGTTLAADVLNGPLDSQPSDLVSIGNTLYFAAEDGIHGREVFSIQTRVLAGDINNDGSVTFADFLVLSSNFGQATEQGGSEGDLDGNGVVNFTDFLLLSAEFGR